MRAHPGGIRRSFDFPNENWLTFPRGKEPPTSSPDICQAWRWFPVLPDYTILFFQGFEKKVLVSLS